MNKKGFTLVEVLAVLVILSLLLILTIPSIRDALTNGKNKINDINKKQIEDAAKIIVDEVIYCNMSDETKKLLEVDENKLDENNKKIPICEQAMTSLTQKDENDNIIGKNINISDLELSNNDLKKCSGTINVKIDSETYKETIDMTNVICK